MVYFTDDSLPFLHATLFPPPAFSLPMALPKNNSPIPNQTRRLGIPLHPFHLHLVPIQQPLHPSTRRETFRPLVMEMNRVDM